VKDEFKKTLFDQYWTHARHTEQELWTFTTVYSAIVGAIFAFSGTDAISDETRTGIYFFGFVLSLLGIALIYCQYQAFLKFVLIAEAIALIEMKVDSQYLRFIGRESNYPHDKRVLTSDVLVLFYSAISATLLFLAVHNWTSTSVYAFVAAFLTFSVLITYYGHNIRRKFAEQIEHARRANTNRLNTLPSGDSINAIPADNAGKE
jgi:hypothetical protein